MRPFWSRKVPSARSIKPSGLTSRPHSSFTNHRSWLNKQWILLNVTPGPSNEHLGDEHSTLFVLQLNRQLPNYLRLFLHLSKTRVLDMVLSLLISRIILRVSVANLYSLTQNVMAQRCLIIRCILTLDSRELYTHFYFGLNLHAYVTFPIDHVPWDHPSPLPIIMKNNQSRYLLDIPCTCMNMCRKYYSTTVAKREKNFGGNWKYIYGGGRVYLCV